jgi:phage tail-like protein
MASWKGRGKGRSGGQPSNTFRGGAGAGGGRDGAQPRPDIRGGAGRGGGRAGAQPTIKSSVSISASVRAVINYGGITAMIRALAGFGAGYGRAGSSIGSGNGEKNPRVADPEGNFVFSLEIGGEEVAQFKEASGLKSTTTVFEIEEGGMNQSVHKLPGQSRWGNIVLRYGVTNSTYMLQWRNAILQDAFHERRNGSIIMRTNSMEEVRRYNFVQAWPVSWDGPTFESGGADIAVESIELAHHGITVS